MSHKIWFALGLFCLAAPLQAASLSESCLDKIEGQVQKRFEKELRQARHHHAYISLQSEKVRGESFEIYGIAELPIGQGTWKAGYHFQGKVRDCQIDKVEQYIPLQYLVWQ